MIENPRLQKGICNWLSNQGYGVHVCESAHKIHPTFDRIRPKLIIVSKNIKGLNVESLRRYTEKHHSSFYSIQTNSVVNNDQVLEDRNDSIISFHHLQFIKDIQGIIRNSQQNVGHNDKQSKDILLAKRLLMKKLHYSEQQAYAHLRKTSMNKCLPMRVVAEKVIESYNKYGERA